MTSWSRRSPPSQPASRQPPRLEWPSGARFPEGEWGPIETVRHLIAVEHEVHRARLTQVAKEEDPHWTWTEPGLAPGFDDASLLEVLTVFARRRAKTVATVRALDEAGWERYGTHETYGRLDVAGLLGLAIDHDARASSEPDCLITVG